MAIRRLLLPFAFRRLVSRINGMADSIQSVIGDHLALAQKVAQELSPAIVRVGQVLCDALGGGGKLLTFGNGGSAADAQHLAEEMLGRFQRQRRPLAAISLTADGSALTCIANDFGYEHVFSRQVLALANPGDVAVAFSTSGNSENVVRGLEAARQKSAITVGLLGNGGGKIAAHADYPLIVPATVAHRIQEMHILIVHLLCEIVDQWAAGEKQS
jgi:D-sedoheptulose 7-phosphate isomerase